MPHPGLKPVLPIVLALVAACPARADIVVNSIAASVSASIDPGPPLTDSSTFDSDSISQTYIGTSNNFTTLSESPVWNGLALTWSGNALITEAKTVSAGPGRTHRGLSSLTFDFDTTTNTNFSLGGMYGFVNDSATQPDSISWSLVGPSTNLSQIALASGGSNQVFFGSGQLGVGTYTFTITARLDERINNASTRSANWNLTSFYLEPLTATPEANLVLAVSFVFGLALLVYVRHRKRRLQPAFATIAERNPVQNASGRMRRQYFVSKSYRTTSRKFDRDELAA